jgi:hypothetical protein
MRYKVMNENDLLGLFDKFLDKVVQRKEIKSDDGNVVLYTMIDKENGLVKEINQLAEANGLHTRFWFPGTCGTRDLRKDRLNIVISAKNVVEDVYLG